MKAFKKSGSNGNGIESMTFFSKHLILQANIFIIDDRTNLIEFNSPNSLDNLTFNVIFRIQNEFKS